MRICRCLSLTAVTNQKQNEVWKKNERRPGEDPRSLIAVCDKCSRVVSGEELSERWDWFRSTKLVSGEELSERWDWFRSAKLASGEELSERWDWFRSAKLVSGPWKWNPHQHWWDSALSGKLLTVRNPAMYSYMKPAPVVCIQAEFHFFYFIKVYVEETGSDRNVPCNSEVYCIYIYMYIYIYIYLLMSR